MSRDILFAQCLLFLLIFLENVCSKHQSHQHHHRLDHGHGSGSDLQIIKNLDDQTYEELMNEIPLLKKVFKGNRKDGSFQFNSSALPMLYRGEILERPNGPLVMMNFDVTTLPSPTPRAAYRNSSFGRGKSVTYRTRWPTVQHATSSLYNARRQGPWQLGFRWGDLTFTAYWFTIYPHIISCYWCGLNDTLIPSNSLCYTIWDAEDTRMRDVGRFFRARCHYYDYYRFYDRQIKLVRWYPSTIEYVYDHGLKTCMFGPYMKGCFKRFVDVGPLYTARGCRGAFLPWRAYTRSFAAHRLMRLEIVARGHDDVCIHSPEAALTPYSRAISLWVRYHVCVCNKPYCNAGAPLAALLTLLGKSFAAFIVLVAVVQ